jgi:hypothetical protein
MQGMAHRSVTAALVAVLMVATATPSRTWGRQGHRLVGLVAASRLTPLARQQVAWLLDARTLADVSSWADQYIEGNAQTALWHYVNFVPFDAPAYDRGRDCPLQPGVAAGSRNDTWRDCAVDRILYSQARLADTTLDRADRAVALKFLVHFVGDLHQPFHALGVERGGNGILVSLFGTENCGTDPARPVPCNLHGVWDSALIARRALEDEPYLAVLEKRIAEHDWAKRPVGTPAEWAGESRDLAKAALLPMKGAVDDAYYERHMRVIDEQVAVAGIRLAAVINGILAP